MPVYSCNAFYNARTFATINKSCLVKIANDLSIKSSGQSLCLILSDLLTLFDTIEYSLLLDKILLYSDSKKTYFADFPLSAVVNCYQSP